jgi:undecaprenyl-diphosphatase
MTILQAIILGVLQGLAEFLPISSSAHLALAPWLLGWPEPGLAFDVALHVGTLVAVLGFFRVEWIRLLRALFRILSTRRIDGVEERRAMLLIVATIPGGIAGLLLEKYAESTFRAPALIAWMLIIMGIVLWAVDRFAPERRPLDAVTWGDALLIGLAQMFAIIPGVSRSGSTIAAGRGVALERPAAATFSFLMSMPIIAAAAVLKVPQVIHAQGITTPFVAGILASGISGWLAISVLLRYISRHSFGVFAVYRVLLGIGVLILLQARG